MSGDESSAVATLEDLRTLRRKVRQDRWGYPFPLLLFGALLLVAPYVHQDFWLAGVTGGVVVTALWYRRRGVRVGVEADTTNWLLAAGAAVLGFVVGAPLLSTLFFGLYSRPEVNLPIMLGAAVGVLISWRRGRRLAVVLFSVLGFASIGVYLIRGMAGLLVIAAGLLVLAWLERSALCAAIGVAFTGTALLANLYDMPNALAHAGIWRPDLAHDSRLQLLCDLALPAAVLLAGGLIALIWTNRAAR
ncbi:hypothetical protein [Amycolatopsis granulosa]|uniref:hypothetical protein n=1 Tax=Amycolatopsis granulosa TaxID=185684 RepID=UPI001421A273|nr:hypothetical protein [Amycolatopsis granulosa]NIH87089.1 hypothetical protein [Amycolatopsis granulosa]